MRNLNQKLKLIEEWVGMNRDSDENADLTDEQLNEAIARLTQEMAGAGADPSAILAKIRSNDFDLTDIDQEITRVSAELSTLRRTNVERKPY